MNEIELLARQLRGDEDTRPCVYRDSRGYWTIGVGRLVDERKPGAGLRPNEMEFMLQNDIAERTAQLTKRLPWVSSLDPARRGVLLNMAFQLGVDGLLAFTKALALVQQGKYIAAAAEMLNSDWAKQTPLRAKRLAEQMATGAWQFGSGK